jgi:hypothetical protein
MSPSGTRRITADELREIASMLNAKDGAPWDRIQRAYAAAMWALGEWVGRAWVEREIFNPGHSARFLRKFRNPAW